MHTRMGVRGCARKKLHATRACATTMSLAHNQEDVAEDDALEVGLRSKANDAVGSLRNIGTIYPKSGHGRM